MYIQKYAYRRGRRGARTRKCYAGLKLHLEKTDGRRIKLCVLSPNYDYQRLPSDADEAGAKIG